MVVQVIMEHTRIIEKENPEIGILLKITRKIGIKLYPLL